MTGHPVNRDDRALRMRSIQAGIKQGAANRTPEERAALQAWLRTLPPLTARQKRVLAQVRDEIDAGFVDSIRRRISDGQTPVGFDDAGRTLGFSPDEFKGVSDDR